MKIPCNSTEMLPLQGISILGQWNEVVILSLKSFS